LLKKGRLGEKALEASSYQRVFRNTVCTFFEQTQQVFYLAKFEDKNVAKNYPNWLAVKRKE
jgi:hypothetical protein